MAINIDIEAIAKKAVEKAAKEIVLGAAKRMVPKDTGDLQKSLFVETEAYRNTKGSVSSGVVTNNEHAPFVEFGTGPVGAANKPELPPELSSKIAYHSTGWGIPGDAITPEQAEKYHLSAYKPDKDGEVLYYYTVGAKPHPFLYPALKENKEHITESIANTIKEELRR